MTNLLLCHLYRTRRDTALGQTPWGTSRGNWILVGWSNFLSAVMTTTLICIMNLHILQIQSIHHNCVDSWYQLWTFCAPWYSLIPHFQPTATELFQSPLYGSGTVFRSILRRWRHWHIITLAVWLSGNTLASINVVALRQTRLVLGWVTVCGRVNHLGM